MKLVLCSALATVVACGGPSAPEPARPPDPVVDRQPPIPNEPSPEIRARYQVKQLGEQANRNELLAPWEGSYGGVPPWDRVRAELFPEAFALGLALYLAEVTVIAETAAPPTFENTIEELENAGRHFDRAQTLFGVLSSSLNAPDVQAVDREWSPKISAAYDSITFNAKLFARLVAVAQAPDPKLNDEQKRLLKITVDQFVQRGAKLDAAQQAQLGKINQDMSVLFSDFRNKVLADENTWVVLDSEADLAGLPASLRASYKAAADERKLAGKWVVVNTRSSVDPFLESSSRRDLRHKVWQAFKNRGDNGNANDTNKLISQIVKLRAERAALLGYPSHAHWRMANTMAVDPAKAEELMLRVWTGAAARVKEEVADMQKIANRERTRVTIEPWDYLYYAEKVRKAKYALDQDELKAYFELGNMIKGSFYMAEQLYGLKFDEITGKVPVFHPDVRVWEVKAADGKFVGLFYGDYFARQNKRSGAWKSEYQSRETFTGTPRTAIVSNNNNFTKGAKDAPVLISLDDAQTLFHEFGHALHGLLSEVNYPGLRTTPRDFVEYPRRSTRCGSSRGRARQVRPPYKTGKTLRRSDREGRGGEAVQPGLRDRRVPDVRGRRHADARPARRRDRCRRVRAHHAREARRTEAGCHAPSAAAVHAPVRGRLVLGWLLQLPVVRGDGCRHARGVRRGEERVRQGDGRQAAEVHPRAGKLDGSGGGLSPVPRARSGRQGAAQEARLPDQVAQRSVQSCAVSTPSAGAGSAQSIAPRPCSTRNAFAAAK